MTAALLGLLALLAGVAGADEERVAALIERLGSGTATEKVEALEELGKIRGAEVSRVVADQLKSRDAAVRKAALYALGGRKDDVSLRALRGALKRFAKDRDLLPAAVTAIGVSGDPDAAGPVADLARKAMGSDAGLVRAAIDTLGQLRDPASLRGLVDLLASAGDARAGHHDLIPDILESLRDLTGLPFVRRETWRDWYRHVKKGWQATSLEPPESSDEWRQDGWRFSIALPDEDRWAFKAVRGAAARVVYRGEKEEAGFAWVDVLAHAAAERKPATLAASAKANREWMEGDLRDVSTGAYSVSRRVSGAPALEHTATGILKSGPVVRWRILTFERNGILYTISTHEESGASDRVREEVRAIVDSFRLLDR